MLARLSSGHYTVLAGLLGLVHRLIGTSDQVFGLFILSAQCHAGAEGDQDALVVVQEELLGQVALQALHGLYGSFQAGIGQYDEELLTAVTSYCIGRAQRFFNDFCQVYQGAVASQVSEGVVQLLEVVDVEQGDADRCFAAV